MARILCVVPDLVGVLHGALELCRRLEEDGHEISICVPETAADVARSYGREPLRLPAESALEEFLAQDATSSRLGRWRRLDRRLTAAVERSRVLPWAQEMKALEPDLVLVDTELAEQIVALSGAGLNLAQLNGFSSVWRRPGLTPAHRNVLPGRGLAGSRFGRWVLWKDLVWRKRGRALRQRVGLVGLDRLSRLRALSAAAGFDFERHADDSHWLRPVTFPHLPVLTTHALEFDFPHEPPANVHYVGPQVAEERPGDEVSAEDRRILDEVFARREAGERLIYAAFGSFFTADARRIEAIAAALRPGWRLLLTAGGTAQALDALPDAVTVVSWAPQLEVLRHADVAIVHGGIHTVDESVLAGVPQLVSCGWKTDMAGNTARIVFHGLGLELRANDGPEEIRRHLDRLLDEESFRATARRFGDAYRRYAERGATQRAVERLLGEVAS